ncbi:MAG: hypothetical protein OEY29_15165 [Gammaproteobacteria bacterium]|nr:hypothetical protein [Gammaproteobacteria bacterium]
MRQVFFITDDRMTAMLWQGKQLIAKYEFEDTETNLDDLTDYLENSKNIPASIILDILEEEVVLTTIPHVAVHERKFLIERKLARLNRSSSFFTANIIGRDDGKRRDDRLLVSSLTSDKTLLKWLDIINERKVLVKGIYSLPLIADNVLKVLKIKKGLTLMVSRQSRDFIRQSIYKDGKLFYSRNIPSSQLFDINIFTQDLKKTRKYLENQKLLSTGDSINVLVLASNKFFNQLEGVDELLQDMNFSYARYDDLKKSLAISSVYNISGREIFSSLLLGALVKNHYGRKSDLQHYNNKRKNTWLNVSSIAAAVVLVMVSLKLYIDAEVISQRTVGVQEQVAGLKSENDKLEKNLSNLPATARAMKLFVNNVTDIKQISANGIDKAMIRLSQVFNAYPGIDVKEMKWDISADDAKKSRKTRSRNQTADNMAASTKNRQLVNIVAVIDTKMMSRQQIKATVDGFVASIKKIKAVAFLKITKAPLNTDSNSTLSGVISDSNKQLSEFSFSILMENESHAG